MNKRAKDSSKEYKWDKDSQSYIPKASPLAYTLFINERKDVLHKENDKQPEGKKMSIKQIARKIKSEWNKMTKEDKQKYTDVVEKERKRYDAKCKELSEKGFFMLSNGTKSTDLPKPEKVSGKQREMTPVKQETKRAAPKKK